MEETWSSFDLALPVDEDCEVMELLFHSHYSTGQQDQAHSVGIQQMPSSDHNANFDSYYTNPVDFSTEGEAVTLLPVAALQFDESVAERRLNVCDIMHLTEDGGIQTMEVTNKKARAHVRIYHNTNSCA